ncbi:3-oxoacyl-ACP reductase [Allokutzneria albata]|uniref:3-oxoacyl-[acyl-carrier protein] reductase n=1 Tax=Allokutzneria albata TaxID=211114 RepID=A0A1G9ZLM8_ALLAB|nr:3-oxoacyl-ACP reductase [Allokutzneria albata]SDN22017.1 3-oxoacyl-[acyl-carrier protein] reductase [Allokutzneria albata]
MADRYQRFSTSPLGRTLVRKLGLPSPAPLRRHRPGDPVVAGQVLVGSAEDGRLAKIATAILTGAGAEVVTTPADDEGRFAAIVFDATGITDSAKLQDLHRFFQPMIRRLGPCGRVIVLGTPPEDCSDAAEDLLAGSSNSKAATAQYALQGFTRSLGKEVKRGATVQLVYVSPGADEGIASTLRFFVSDRSAFVSGQVVRVGVAEVAEPEDWERPLAGKTAVVTGASRGIGAAIAELLARDGASVVCLDVPAQGDELAEVANRIGGSTLQLDITALDAPARLAEHLAQRHGGVDIVVHNAGILRDKTLGKMDEQQWDSVIAVNLSAQERINDALLDGVLRQGGRIIGVSSIAGIAGNFGQTNYATSKAGVIGMVQALAPVLARTGGTINAVAPGFIETKMTASIPLFTREMGRRLSSLAQGGLPVDVAETIAWYANPGSAGVNGNVVRVCGQSLLGA